MKKQMTSRAIVTLLCIAVTFAASAQHSHPAANGPTTPVQVGSVILNAGIGIGSSYEGDYYNSPFGLKAAIEWGLWQAGPGVITLGGEAGGSFSSGGYRDYNNYTSSTVIFAARAAWHYGWQVPGLDTYGGVSAGLGFHHYPYKNPDYSHSFVLSVPRIFFGASLFVKPTF